MAVYHGKSAKVWAWDGNNDAHVAEATTEVAATAQITLSTKRILDPNVAHTWTDGGAGTAVVVYIDHTIGKAYFDQNVTAEVTTSGSHVVVANLDLMGNMYGWSIDRTVDVAESTAFGDTAKTYVAGQWGWVGSAEGYFLDTTWKTAFDLIKFWFIRFYIDGTHYFQGWAVINGLSEACSLNEIVTEPLTFQGHGFLTYV